jgi:hypothetical protein
LGDNIKEDEKRGAGRRRREDEKCTQKFRIGKLDRKRPLRRYRSR